MTALETLAAVVGLVLVAGQLAQVGLLTGVFYRLGSLRSMVDAQAGRIEQLETARTKQ